MTRRPLILAAALLGLTACAPSQRRLLRGHHYEEALVALRRGAVDEVEVLAAIERELDVRLHMQAVPAAALRAQLPGAPAIADELALVRVIHDANQVPLTGLAVSLSLLQGQTLFPPIEPGRDVLVKLTGEQLPLATTVERPSSRIYKRIGFLEFVGRLTLNIVTVGVLHDAVPIFPSTGTSAYTETVPPNTADYMRTSPVAESLWTWLAAPSRCDTTMGLGCRYYLLWHRPPASGAPPVELGISVSLGQWPSTAILYSLAIPSGTLEQGLAAMFGDRTRSLDELHRRHGRSRAVVHELDVVIPLHRHDYRIDRDRLARIVLGTRHRPGLRTRPGLRFILAAPKDQPPAQVADLHKALRALGIPPTAIEEQDIAAPPLRVRYDLPPLPAAPL